MNFLDHVGNILKKILHIGEDAATIAAPIVAAEFPEVAPLYTSALGLAAAMQATVPSVQGSGATKLAGMVQALLPQAESWAAQNGINWPVADINKWASAIVDTIKLIPAPSGTAAPAAPAN